MMVKRTMLAATVLSLWPAAGISHDPRVTKTSLLKPSGCRSLVRHPHLSPRAPDHSGGYEVRNQRGEFAP